LSAAAISMPSTQAATRSAHYDKENNAS